MKAPCSLLLFAALSLLAGCPSGKPSKPTVTLYCSLDRIHAEPIIKRFEAESGIDVRVKWDTEASKTTGLVNTLIAEATAPRCDVFWNNEVSQTLRLAERGLLAPYRSEAGASIPDQFKDASGLWHGFAARARVFIVNRKLVPEADRPTRLEDLLAPKYRGKIGIAKPLFGTTATHAAALFATLGEAKAKDFFSKLKANQVVLCSGNAHLKDRVVKGELAYGLTDTDDYNLARLAGAEVDVVFPDQGASELGTLLIPNSIAIMKGAPHQAEAKRLVDALVSSETEALLAVGRSAQIPVRAGIPRPDWIPNSLRPMKVDWLKSGAAFERARTFLEQDFLGP